MLGSIGQKQQEAGRGWGGMGWGGGEEALPTRAARAGEDSDSPKVRSGRDCQGNWACMPLCRAQASLHSYLEVKVLFYFPHPLLPPKGRKRKLRSRGHSQGPNHTSWLPFSALLATSGCAPHTQYPKLLGEVRVGRVCGPGQSRMRADSPLF